MQINKAKPICNEILGCQEPIEQTTRLDKHKCLVLESCSIHQEADRIEIKITIRGNSCSSRDFYHGIVSSVETFSR